MKHTIKLSMIYNVFGMRDPNPDRDHDVLYSYIGERFEAWVMNFMQDFEELFGYGTEVRKFRHFERFIAVWNALVGRSTTKASNLYVVLASCFDFKLKQLRAFHSPEEKMMRLTFSFAELPFSLFFNLGNRLRPNQHHNNRWLPTEVSSLLLSPGSTIILPSNKISKYSDQGTRLDLRMEDDMAIYLIDNVVSECCEYILHTDQASYRIQPTLSSSDTFSASGFIATCMFIDKTRMLPANDFRGACFHIERIQDLDRILTGGAVVEMAYLCLVVVTHSTSEVVSTAEYTGHGVHPICKLRVKFGKRLPRCMILHCRPRYRPYLRFQATETTTSLRCSLDRY
jgi:hypothetical protein